VPVPPCNGCAPVAGGLEVGFVAGAVPNPRNPVPCGLG